MAGSACRSGLRPRTASVGGGLVLGAVANGAGTAPEERVRQPPGCAVAPARGLDYNRRGVRGDRALSGGMRDDPERSRRECSIMAKLRLLKTGHGDLTLAEWDK